MKWLTAIFFMLFTSCAFAQYDSASIIDSASVAADTTIATGDYEGETGSVADSLHRFQRMYMNEEKLEALRRKGAFKYDDIDSPQTIAKPAKAISAFKKFDATILLWLIAAFAVVVIILQFSGIRMGRLFSSSKIRSSIEADEAENIHDINYSQAIAGAVTAENYLLATRLLYLRSLKALSDKDFIHWTANKTNWQYVYEVTDKEIRKEFIKITSMFEYVCYGHMEVSASKFDRVHQTFNNFKRLVG